MASNDIYSSLIQAIGVADNILQQNKSLTALERQKMKAIKDGLSGYKNTAFTLREYTVGGGDSTTPANNKIA
ncbi:hypothetical protein L3496_22865 [Klebsiella pneumoniae]|uniref:hypothetical protein n=1 Tax=Klebsiella pneumoniae TaxID=573 RepID=UPI0024070BFF|nr:hypothetical protein [Klebsiella pneumoniae]MDG0021975.1 hypothetical protein [Klebsiella pneumoniae]